MWRPGPSRREAPTVPPEEAWAAVRVASRAPEGCQRRGRRLQVAAVARRGQRAPRGPARWVVVQARRALAQAREAAWERAAARPMGCSRGAESGAPSAVEGLWAARLQLPWQRRRLVRQCRRRPSGWTDCQRLCLRLTVTTGASWGWLCPTNLKIRRRGLARTGQSPTVQDLRLEARQLMTLAVLAETLAMPARVLSHRQRESHQPAPTGEALVERPARPGQVPSQRQPHPHPGVPTEEVEPPKSRVPYL